MPATIDRIREVVEAILGESPATLLELKRRLAGDLAIEPRAELLQALAALPEIGDPVGRAVATRAAVLHLLLESAHSAVWERPEADPAALDRALAEIPAILDLARREEAELDASIAGVDRLQRDAVARLHGSLKRPEDPLIAAFAVVPELARLAAASRADRLLVDAPHLHPEEAEIVAAAAHAASTPRPYRALVDAVALRSAIDRALSTGADADGLCALRDAHTVISHRLDSLRAHRFEQTRRSDAALDAARKRLFVTYLLLAKALAGGAVEPTGDMRESILAAEREGAVIDAERAQAAEAIKSATDGATDAPRAVAVEPEVQDLVRERRRRKALTWTVAALVPMSVGVNLWLMPRGRNGALVELAPLNVAMPVSEAMPIGAVLYSRTATFLWDDMSEAERSRRLTDLGKIAARQGYRSVVVVDDARSERGYWTAAGGAMLREGPESIGPVAP